MVSHEEMTEFRNSLDQVGINVGGCAVFQSSDGEYFLLTKVKTSDSELYIINGRFFYDYTSKWLKTQPWNLLYIKVE